MKWCIKFIILSCLQGNPLSTMSTSPITTTTTEQNITSTKAGETFSAEITQESPESTAETQSKCKAIFMHFLPSWKTIDTKINLIPTLTVHRHKYNTCNHFNSSITVVKSFIFSVKRSIHKHKFNSYNQSNKNVIESHFQIYRLQRKKN